jgi:hypothetical protein
VHLPDLPHRVHPDSDVGGVLFRGGPILTVDPARPRPEAVATRGGRIVAVGEEAYCRRVLDLDSDSDSVGSADGSDRVTVVELGGRALLPGFVDAQVHPLAMCFFADRLDLSNARSIADVLDALADQAKITPPGEWVLGLQLTADRLAEDRLPTMLELDSISAGRAVVVLCRDGHTSLGNTVALAAAGVRGNRADPPGGAFDRDERGRLTGVCRETATRILLSGVPEPDLDDYRSKMDMVFAQLAGDGITSVGFVLQTDDEGPAGRAAALESLGMMLFVEDLALGSHSILCGEPHRAIDARASSSLHDPPRNRIVGGVKLFLDGTLGARTAALHHPYSDSPADKGWLTVDPKVALARMETAHLAGLQVDISAIGDAANTLALDLVADLQARHPVSHDGTRPRHRIGHVSVLDETAAERFVELGVTAVVQPLYLRAESDWLHKRLGPERAQRTYPFRTLADAGVVLAGSSTAPLEDTDVLAGIAACVTRHGFEPAQALTAEEAVTMYTHGGATAQGREHLTGRIKEDLQADLVVLSDDPTAVPTDAITDIEVELTIVRGHVVHRKP